MTDMNIMNNVLLESFLPDMTYSMYRELLRKIICIGIIIQKDAVVNRKN